MAFCTKCGKQVADSDVFCAVCGTRQAAPSSGPAASGGPEILHKINERNAAVLCYLPFVGWIPAIVVLASARFRDMRQVRFHAFQGLYLFVAWLLVDWFITPMVSFGPHFGPQRAVVHLLQLVILGAWIFMLVKTSQHQFFRLPVIGEIAERSVAEQR